MPVEKRSTALHSPPELREQRPAQQNTTAEHQIPDLEAKRQELLRDFDWVGLEKMKPVKMKFADVEDRDLIGKRRRLATNHEEGPPSAPRPRRPVVNAYERLDMLRANSSGRPSPEKISIHIGSSDHLFSQDIGSRHSSRKEHSHESPPSEKMLFQDRDSASGSSRSSAASLQASLQQGIPSSEEMLFDHQWSSTSLPPTVEPANVINDSWSQPKHQPLPDDENDRDSPSVHLISSGDESDNLTDLESVEEGFEHQQDEKPTADQEDRLLLPELAMSSVLTSTRLNKLEGFHQPTVGHEETLGSRRNKQSTTKISPTDLETKFDRGHGDERATFAPATPPKSAALFPGNETCGTHKVDDPEEESEMLDRREAQKKSKNVSNIVTTEKNKTAANGREDE
ncbi:MAG: hypothetical protein Q9212_004615, partial [Teloschistes hypoglaucus]